MVVQQSKGFDGWVVTAKQAPQCANGGGCIAKAWHQENGSAEGDGHAGSEREDLVQRLWKTASLYG